MRRWRWRRGSCKVSGALFEQKKQQEHALAMVAKEAKQAKRWQLTAIIKRERESKGERERGGRWGERERCKERRRLERQVRQMVHIKTQNLCCGWSASTVACSCNPRFWFLLRRRWSASTVACWCNARLVTARVSTRFVAAGRAGR